MTLQGAPKETPKTSLDGPKPSRTSTQRCFRHKEQWARIPTCCRKDFAVFLQAVETTAQFVEKGNTPMETLRKRRFKHAQKVGGHSPSSSPNPVVFCRLWKEKKAPRQGELDFFPSLLASFKVGSAACGEAAQRYAYVPKKKKEREREKDREREKERERERRTRKDVLRNLPEP